MDVMKMFKELKNMQEQVNTMKEEALNFETEGTAGGGMVRLTLSGGGEMSKLWIDPELFKEDDKEILEDLIMTAYHNAKEKNDQIIVEKTQEAMGNMELPAGIKLPF